MVEQSDVVGVVGDAPAAAAAAGDAGATAVTDDAAAVVAADPDLAVAAGEEALVSLVRAGVDAPVVPVAAGRGVGSVPREAAGSAVEAALSGAADRRDHPVYAVSVAGERAARVLLDAGLFADGPARISEFSVRTPDGPVAQFRADGVVVGTPAGSRGYLSAAGGPLVQPGTGVVGVAPVARFSTARDRWVLRPAGLTLAVERGETPVSLVADGRVAGPVAPGDPVRFGRDGTVTTVVAPESRPFFG